MHAISRLKRFQMEKQTVEGEVFITLTEMGQDEFKKYFIHAI
jgi:hypothetical protein